MKVTYHINHVEALRLLKEYAPAGSQFEQSDEQFDSVRAFGVQPTEGAFVATSYDLLQIRVDSTEIPEWVRRLVQKVEDITREEVSVTLKYDPSKNG